MGIGQQAQIMEVTADNFDQVVVDSHVPVLVNFQTPWSKRMGPLLGETAERFCGRLRVVQVNIASNPELAARFRIRAVPTLLIFKNGMPVEFIVGTVPSRFIFETVSKVLGLAPRGPRTRSLSRTAHWPSLRSLVFDSTLA